MKDTAAKGIRATQGTFSSCLQKEKVPYVLIFMCGTVSSMLSGLKIRSLGLNTLGTM